MKSNPWTLANKFLLILLFGALTNPAFAEDVPAEAEEPQASEEQADEDEEADTADSDDMTEEEPETYRFEKSGCDFTVEFPEAPYTSKRCSEPDPTNLTRARDCYEVVTYTQIYDMTTTVNVSLSCNKSSQTAYEQYSESVMRATLQGMANQNALDDASINFKQVEGMNMAGLSGTGRTGRQDQIYIAQLWVSEHSVMTIEGQIIGDARHDADKTFSDILRSISFNGMN